MKKLVDGVVSYLKELPGKVADVIVVPLLVVVVLALAAIVAGFLVHTHVAVWVVVLAIAVGLVAGVLISRHGHVDESSTEAELDELRRRADELSPYDTYAEHVRDALGDLRKAIRGELPSFSLRDFIEAGIFQPAHRLLARDEVRGDVRFSILHERDGDFVMADGDDLFPAFGHRLESRQRFRLTVAGSFSQLAYERNRVFSSGALSVDERFQRHQLADADRSYESIVSVPIRSAEGGVDGVLNVIAASRDAFSAVDRTYIGLLGSVIDVARATADGLRLRAAPPGDVQP